MNQFLDKLDTPTITTSTAAEIDAPLTADEVISSITSLQSAKSPGPDGFPAEFYKKFHLKLAPLLLSVFEESLKRGSLPQTLRQASISLLHKEGKDPTCCGSYRPISLLNVDFKILSKLLATRLERVLPSIISDEQTGFIKGRHSFFNIRSLLNIIYSKNHSTVPEVVISLDAEKAFDRVEWGYLFAVLKKFGFGDSFISWIHLLYTTPLASVCTNNVNSEYFTLSRGTRQGCPLSPLLFTLAIEPLSVALRTSPLFQGVIRGGTEYRVALYADDLLLYVTNPTIHLSSIMKILLNFGSFSGYKINIQKSECFSINPAAQELRQTDLNFHLASSGFRYLGVHITTSFKALRTANFNPLLTYVRLAFQRWANLPVSLLGRINIIKMTILPKFLYLFQSIPLFLPKSFFKSVNRMFSSFIWANKTPRISMTSLQQGKLSGGLALPNLMFYYWAANIQKYTYWLNGPQAAWCCLEAQSCFSSSLSALLFSSLPVSLLQFTDNPVLIGSLKIWYQFRRHFNSVSASALTPICNNHLFPPSLVDSSFCIWARKGIKCFYDLFKDNIFLSFSDLCSLYDLPSYHLFRYFQIRHCASSILPEFPSQPLKPWWEDLFQLKPHSKALISQIYTLVMASGNYSTNKIASSWEQELGLQFVEGYWDKVIDKIHSSASCARLSLIQFKTVYRLHFSRSRLSKIYPGIPDLCNRCNTSPCDLTHMFFACSSLQLYWTFYFEVLSHVLSVTLKPCPLVAIFGVSEDATLNLSRKQLDIIAFTSLLARRRILLSWKAPHPPARSRWLEDVMFFLKLEKIKFRLRGNVNKFSQVWQPFIIYFNSLKTLTTD
ncbi:unnamed protein product [Oreochromis niloticus]|nr:unnamed protein product [Mustela putorius furo]